MLLSHLPYGCECLAHDLLKAAINFGFSPEKTWKVLHPFEIGNSDSPRICNHVWNHKNAIRIQNIVGCWRRRAVGGFYDNPGPDMRRVFFGNLFFKRGGNQKVRFKSPKLFAIERLNTFKARNAAMLRGMHQEFCGIESGGLVKRPCMILDRNHFCARFAEQPRRNASYIAESLYRNARARRNIDPFPARRFTPYDKDAAPGRFPAAQAAAKRNWLACDSAHHSVPLIH